MEANTSFPPEGNSSILTILSADNSLKLWLEEESEDEFNKIEDEKIVDQPEPEVVPARQQKNDQKDTD